MNKTRRRKQKARRNARPLIVPTPPTYTPDGGYIFNGTTDAIVVPQYTIRVVESGFYTIGEGEPERIDEA